MQKLVISCTLLLLANTILPVGADDAQSETPMQTIDSESAKPAETPAQPIESEPAKPIETPTQTIESEPAKPAETPMQTIDNAEPPKTEPEPDQIIKPRQLNVEPAPSDKEPGVTAEPAEPDKKDMGEKATHFVTHLPQRLGLFTANVIVAAPATFVRRSAQYTASNTKELIGDHKNPILLVPAGTLSLYYGLTSGLVEGTTFGIINSWKHSADGHISKTSLGLEDDK